jgi:hypothetical protein
MKLLRTATLEAAEIYISACRIAQMGKENCLLAIDIFTLLAVCCQHAIILEAL